MVKYKNELVSIISKHLPGAKIYLFGSRARGTFNPGSDIDIAVDIGVPINWSVLGALKEDVEESNIPLFVDVVDINNVSEDMRKQIKKDGILWDGNN